MTQASRPVAETHIAGVLVHARPEYIADIGVAVSMLPKASVTYQTDDGRAVVVLEASSAHEVARQLDSIRSLRGVLNVAPVYQHAESDEEMSKEMDA
jgi:nitrate reductase NapD